MKVVVYFSILLLLLFSLTGCGQDSTSTDSASSNTKQFVYLEFPETVAEVEAMTGEATNRFNNAIEEILSRETFDFSNTIHAFNDAAYHALSSTINFFGIVRDLATSADIRAAATAGYNELTSLKSRAFVNQGLYQAFTAAVDNSDSLNAAQQALVAEILSMFKLNGQDLNSADQETLISLKEQVNDLVAQFQDNIYSSDLSVTFTGEKLQGLSDAELSLFETDNNGNYVYEALSYGQFVAILTYAVSEETRQTAYVTHYSIAKDENPELFAEIAQLRARIAELLGYDSYSVYRIDSLMAGTPQTAEAFLDNLYGEIAGKKAAEVAILQELKRQETGDGAAILQRWDIPFYENLYAREAFDLDLSSMKKYFAFEQTWAGMLSIFEGVLKVEIIERDTSDMQLWSESVRLYEVRDASSDQPLGLFYFDPYPRDGKYNYYEVWPAVARNISVSGEITFPTSVLIGNWPEPDTDSNTPGLLAFDDMVVLFHEFGHTLHNLLIDVDYAALTDARWDFIEVPSQLFERWCYAPDVLATFAVNYQDTSDPLPADFAEKVKQKKEMFSGLDTGNQIAYAMTDLSIYDMPVSATATLDVDAVYAEIARRYYLPFPETASQMAQIVHLVESYDSRYYAYQWSNAIAADIKSVFDQSGGGLLDSATGQSYRTEILAPGLSRDENESLYRFLGRAWTIEAYIEELTLHN